MNPAVLQRAHEERRREQLVQEAFDAYLDCVVEALLSLGAEEPAAIESVFSCAAYLGEEGVLPAFPEGRVSYQTMGRWLTAAADFGFAEFVVEAVSE